MDNNSLLPRLIAFTIIAIATMAFLFTLTSTGIDITTKHVNDHLDKQIKKLEKIIEYKCNH